MSGAAVATIAAKARQRIVNHFTAANALSVDHAVAFEGPQGLVERRIWQRMLAFGAVVEAEPGRFYLDEVKLGQFKKISLARVLGGLAVAGFVAAGAIAFGG